MVRMSLPNRLKSHNGKIGVESQDAGKGISPMLSATDGKGLLLKTTVLRVGPCVDIFNVHVLIVESPGTQSGCKR